jgi:hypothetical protein
MDIKLLNICGIREYLPGTAMHFLGS